MARKLASSLPTLDTLERWSANMIFNQEAEQLIPRADRYNREIPTVQMDLSKQTKLLYIQADRSNRSPWVKEALAMRVFAGWTKEELDNYYRTGKNPKGRKYNCPAWWAVAVDGLFARYHVGADLHYTYHPEQFKGPVREVAWSEDEAWLGTAAGTERRIRRMRKGFRKSGIILCKNPMKKVTIKIKAKDGTWSNKEVEQKMVFEQINPDRLEQLLHECRESACLDPRNRRNDAIVRKQEKRNRWIPMPLHVYRPQGPKSNKGSSTSISRYIGTSSISVPEKNLSSSWAEAEQISSLKTFRENEDIRFEDCAPAQLPESTCAGVGEHGGGAAPAAPAPKNPAPTPLHPLPPLPRNAQPCAAAGPPANVSALSGVQQPTDAPEACNPDPGVPAPSSHKWPLPRLADGTAAFVWLGEKCKVVPEALFKASFTETGIRNIAIFQQAGMQETQFTLSMCKWIDRKHLLTKDVRSWITIASQTHAQAYVDEYSDPLDKFFVLANRDNDQTDWAAVNHGEELRPTSLYDLMRNWKLVLTRIKPFHLIGNPSSNAAMELHDIVAGRLIGLREKFPKHSKNGSEIYYVPDDRLLPYLITVWKEKGDQGLAMENYRGGTLSLQSSLLKATFMNEPHYFYTMSTKYPNCPIREWAELSEQEDAQLRKQGMAEYIDARRRLTAARTAKELASR